MVPGIEVSMTKMEEELALKDEFQINKYSFLPIPLEDLVRREAPFVHYQILRPKNQEEREKTLKYFNEHKKLFITSINRSEILLYLGCTETIYIKSKMANVTEKQLETLLNRAWQWFCLYGDDKGG